MIAANSVPGRKTRPDGAVTPWHPSIPTHDESYPSARAPSEASVELPEASMQPKPKQGLVASSGDCASACASGAPALASVGDSGSAGDPPEHANAKPERAMANVARPTS